MYNLLYFFLSAVVAVDGKPVKLQLCDTAGQVCHSNTPIGQFHVIATTMEV